MSPAMRLALTLRLLAVGSYLDQVLSFRLAGCTVYHILRSTVYTIHSTLPMPGVPLEDTRSLQGLATKFHNSRTLPNPLFGCIGALDGIAIKIAKPADNYVPRNFFCRKGHYAIPVQAVADASYRFLYMSEKCPGSTHDSVTFHVSSLARRLRRGELLPGYWIAGDAAFQCADGIVTPWPNNTLTDDEDGIFKDSFNFYQSSCRIHVEQAFGMLVKRWVIFWRPINFGICDSLPIVSTAMRLHNYAIDQGEPICVRGSFTVFEQILTANAFRTWWCAAKTLRASFTNEAGRRRELEMSDLRTMLTADLRRAGVCRPASS